MSWRRCLGEYGCLDKGNSHREQEKIKQMKQKLPEKGEQINKRTKNILKKLIFESTW